MPQIKQKTVNGVLVTLNRYSSDAPNQEYDYHVEANGKQVGPIVPTKERGMELFRQVVEKARQGGERAAWGRGGFDETRRRGTPSTVRSGRRRGSAGIGGGFSPLEDDL